MGYYTVFELHQVIDVNTKEVLSEDERLEHATQIENESQYEGEVSFIKVEELEDVLIKFGVYDTSEISLDKLGVVLRESIIKFEKK